MAPKRPKRPAVGHRRPCAFTCMWARRGHRKPDGECCMTRLAYGDGASDERPVYTVCDNCGRALCVECLERVADNWIRLPIAPLSRTTCCMPWRFVRGAKREVVGRVRGFEPRRGGGGTWRAHCPPCSTRRFSKSEPSPVEDLSGRPQRWTCHRCSSGTCGASCTRASSPTPPLVRRAGAHSRGVCVGAAGRRRRRARPSSAIRRRGGLQSFGNHHERWLVRRGRCACTPAPANGGELVLLSRWRSARWLTAWLLSTRRALGARLQRIRRRTWHGWCTTRRGASRGHPQSNAVASQPARDDGVRTAGSAAGNCDVLPLADITAHRARSAFFASSDLDLGG